MSGGQGACSPHPPSQGNAEAEGGLAQRVSFSVQQKTAVERLLAESQPNVIIHLAAVVGGIGANAVQGAKLAGTLTLGSGTEVPCSFELVRENGM